MLDVLDGWRAPEPSRTKTVMAARGWRAEVDRIIELDGSPTLSQAQMIGILNSVAGQRDVVVNAAGSMPGDLHRLWPAGSTKGYDLECGNSCMGYEIPGAIGNALADRTRYVFGLIGDGTYLMLSQELLTAVQEHVGITIVIVDNFGFGSIAAVPETRGSQGFGTRFHERGPALRHDGDRLEVDFAANAASYGAKVWSVSNAPGFRSAIEEAKACNGVSVVYVKVDVNARFGGSGAWWDVPVAAVSTLESSEKARSEYESERASQHLYL